MSGGALEMMQTLLRDKQATDRRSFDAATAANDEAIGVMSRPRNSNAGALALAAGFLSPTKSGSFAESLGKATQGYADVAQRQEDAEMDRATKIANLKMAHARLLGGFGDSQFNASMKQFELPGMALQHKEALEDYSDEGSDIPVVGGGPRADAGGYSDPAPAPAPRSTVTPPFDPNQNPNARVGSLAPVAEMAQLGFDDDDMLMGGSGNDMLAPAGGPPAGNPPAPGQMAQAGAPGQPAPPAGAPAQTPAPPSQEKQLYDWALQVRAASAGDPGKWARRPKHKAALAQAEKIIDDYRASQSQSSTQEHRSQILQLREDVMKSREGQLANKNPIQQKRQEMELKRMEEVEAQARDAGDTRTAISKTRAARENLWMGEEASTGGLGGLFTGIANRFVDTGKGALDEATGAMRSAVIKAQNSGAISNFEVKMFDAQVPGLGMGKASSDWVLNVGDAIANRQEEQAKFYRRYSAEYGTIQGADEQWQKFMTENPIIDRTPEGKPWLYADRVGKWQPYLKPPAYLTESGRGAAPGADRAPSRTDSAPGTTVTDPDAIKALEILRQRGVLK